jgi:hypothetical protein
MSLDGVLCLCCVCASGLLLFVLSDHICCPMRCCPGIRLFVYHRIFALQVLKLDGEIRALAEELKDETSLLVFGRGYNYATALEAALKVRKRGYE